MKKILEKIGPGPIVAAAFIGPGTVMVCTLAGFQFGYSLIWGLVLSILATVILQEMSGRIGLVTGKDLSELIRSQNGNRLFKIFQLVLVLTAIVLGNIAYESGNITGANLGLEVFWDAPEIQLGLFQFNSGTFILGIIALILLWFGNSQILEKALVGLVIVMSVSFLLTVILLRPDWAEIAKGLIPSLQEGQIATLVALVGTTVVPYNLFLYASLSKNKWKAPKQIHLMRWDIGLSVILGGLVSSAILIVGALNESESITTARDVAAGLEGTLGQAGAYLMAVGLLAAGLTSSITAPLAAALVICGVLGWSQENQSKSMRGAFVAVVGSGLIFASLGIKPVQLITLAQLANGILLPMISAWLIWVANQKSWMGSSKNTLAINLISGIIWLITLALGLKSIGAVLNFKVF
ncbi:Nramp family divalent metal transporter [Algoriphagus vanfongensis]|uniref:Nramp family divalent metal transporter n=1 Tax=Algoriphagus vanfongensis TaxID=426371 RepID=UPI000402EE4F|nr:Nramp family divalent metal transporter [Algoriphagus vanfongensis]